MFLSGESGQGRGGLERAQVDREPSALQQPESTDRLVGRGKSDQGPFPGLNLIEEWKTD